MRDKADYRAHFRAGFLAVSQGILALVPADAFAPNQRATADHPLRNDRRQP